MWNGIACTDKREMVAHRRHIKHINSPHDQILASALASW